MIICRYYIVYLFFLSIPIPHFALELSFCLIALCACILGQRFIYVHFISFHVYRAVGSLKCFPGTQQDTDRARGVSFLFTMILSYRGLTPAGN